METGVGAGYAMSRQTPPKTPTDQGSDRLRALQLLRRIERDDAFASLVLQDHSGFVRTLVLGVLRWRSRLDFMIRSFATRRVEPELMDVLRLGAFQLLYSNVAVHAAVGETVELAPKRARGFVNAILRRVSAGNLPEPPDLATRTGHPEWLMARWIRTYGVDRAARIAEANQELSFPDILTDSPPAGAQPSPFVEGMWRLHGSSANLEGLVLDEGSAVVASIAARTGRDILDLAAAPGGKSAVMQRLGARVVSNDVSIGRILGLRQHSQRLVVSDGLQPPFGRSFETVLLDAPCSATGTIRKNPEIKWRLREEDLSSFAGLQQQLLDSALTLAGKTLVYSTCSLEREENDAVVESVLASRSEFERVDLSPFSDARLTPWIDDGVLRLTPDAGTDGFTAFMLQRKTRPR